ncbi:hypothetical protein APHAL10511_004327 [Amanita phalloides]|nr:hypothetical protein APHAL10511_004327 [Amanita phalloides]
MIAETLHIKKWLGGLAPTAPISIGKATRHHCDSDWTAEGSLHPPVKFAERLRALRAPVNTKYFGQPNLNRDTLVIEREINVELRDRVPLNLSVASSGAAIIQDNSDLGTLNFFSDMEQDAGNFSEPNISPPSLMVSTSDAVFQISLESSSDFSADVPTTLAARRGKKELPHLSLKQGHQIESYPGIPTAFLGATSEHWLQHDHTTRPGVTHMDLQSMVSTLQSYRVAEPFLSGCGTKYDLRNKATVDQDSDTDEWAFADAFVSEYGDLSLRSSSANTTISFIVSSTGITDSEISDTDVNEAVLPQSLVTCSSPPQISESPISQGASLKTPPQEIRGILKGCRSVRFASLPGRQRSEEQTWSNESISRVPPTRTSAIQYTGVKGAGCASTVSYRTSQGRSRPPNPFKSVLNQNHSPADETDSGNRPMSSASWKVRNDVEPEVAAKVLQRHPVAHNSDTITKMPTAPLGRLRSVRSAKSMVNKENGKRLIIKSNRKFVDENAGRRDSSEHPEKNKSTRKKMQTPLRTILTRFK